MDLHKAEVLARNLIGTHCAPDVRFVWTMEGKRLGFYGERRDCDGNLLLRRIALSRRWVRTNPEDVVKSIILHEIAHHVAGLGTGHGPRWVEVAQALGGHARHELTVDYTHTHPPAGAYIHTCPHCGTKGYVLAKPRRTYSCTPCRKNLGLISHVVFTRQEA